MYLLTGYKSDTLYYIPCLQREQDGEVVPASEISLSEIRRFRQNKIMMIQSTAI